MPSALYLDDDFRNRIQPAVNAAVQVAGAANRIGVADDAPVDMHHLVGIVAGDRVIPIAAAGIIIAAAGGNF